MQFNQYFAYFSISTRQYLDQLRLQYQQRFVQPYGISRTEQFKSINRTNSGNTFEVTFESINPRTKNCHISSLFIEYCKKMQKKEVKWKKYLET